MLEIEFGRIMKSILYIFYFGFLVLATALLSACASYNSPPTTMTSCIDYEEYLKSVGDKDYKSMMRSIKNAGDDDLLNKFPGIERSKLSSLRQHPMDYWIHAKKKKRSEPINPIIIRYSQAGDLVSRCDYSLILKTLIANPNPKLVVVYFHGWNNDSGPANIKTYNNPFDDRDIKANGGDLKSFKTFINRLKDGQGEQNPKDVIGIYVSWNGHTPAKVLNYYRRKQVADTIARSGHIPRLLGAIENIVKNSGDKKEGPEATIKETVEKNKNTLVYMGHSFGARILYSSVAPPIISKTQYGYCDRSRNDYSFERIQAGPDLVVLANPVVSSSFYKAFDEFRYTQCNFSDQKKPIMLTIQSREDTATSIWYAVAEQFTNIVNFNTDQKAPTAFGHFEHHQTHALEESKSCPVSENGVDLRDNFSAAGICLKFAPAYVPAPSENSEMYGLPFIGGEEKDVTACIEPNANQTRNGSGKTSRCQRASPFIVASASEGVLGGHTWLGDFHEGSGKKITQSSLSLWLQEYIKKHSQTIPQQSP